MLRKLLYAAYFCLLAGLGVVLGCYIHSARTNQTTLMSGVAFVREFPHGEHIVGYIETRVFSWQEQRDLEKFRKTHEGKIQIDPEVLKKHQDLYRDGGKRP